MMMKFRLQDLGSIIIFIKRQKHLTAICEKAFVFRVNDT